MGDAVYPGARVVGQGVGSRTDHAIGVSQRPSGIISRLIIHPAAIGFVAVAQTEVIVCFFGCAVSLMLPSHSPS